MRFTCKSCATESHIKTHKKTGMTPASSSHSRLLLCASAAHCAQVLQAASALRVNLHGLQPHTSWPEDSATPTLVLWALVPAHAATSHTQQLEAAWRAQMLQGGHGLTIHMLYGSASQQATQLAPWISQRTAADTALDPDCKECLDASSEQKLFQHLFQRT